MRIVLTSQDGLTKIGLITTLKALRQQFPDIGWLRDPSFITDEHFIDNGLPARVSAETAPPATAEFGERAVDDDERLPDGTWQQTWTVEAQITLAEAKTQCGQVVCSVYWEKVVNESARVQEIQANNADPLAIINARRDVWRPRLANVRTAIQNAATVAEVHALYKQFLTQV